MYCRYCGSEVEENMRFCPTCGKSQFEEMKPQIKTMSSKKSNWKMPYYITTIVLYIVLIGMYFLPWFKVTTDGFKDVVSDMASDEFGVVGGVVADEVFDQVLGDTRFEIYINIPSDFGNLEEYDTTLSLLVIGGGLFLLAWSFFSLLEKNYVFNVVGSFVCFGITAGICIFYLRIPYAPLRNGTVYLPRLNEYVEAEIAKQFYKPMPGVFLSIVMSLMIFVLSIIVLIKAKKNGERLHV